ncbi:2-amino-4-hydroxy-6-hydroxymethyldihydropteridine diphosphokinase [Salipaludibacillus daqingensis]|uniref:2-amino-4-hydroxy-6- hydroxymethyldihydropteridine diphosphokinase n=1 Tax=Salipaludibacillus daqingensis TaxID=3041001 RepID=UPI0024733E68|nr:2-amino-4-hydroxy-6-hydroxymethyldihydropteridine diphosphokinase [Salipaludibacillus daqingensis]
MDEQHISYIALGSNQGARLDHLENAVEKLEGEPRITILASSSIYETKPVGVTDQPAFLNMVVKIATNYTPLDLLKVTQKIEESGGRQQKGTWGPRTIDLDILLFNNENIQLNLLQIPHPRMFERGFVLIPLQELEPNLRLNDGRGIDTYVNQLTDKEGVRKWRSSFGVEE